MRCILVIDDDPLFRDSLATTLRRAGYEVVARDGARDLEAVLAARAFFAVITDLYMPDGDGIEVMMRVRRVSRGVRLIGVSGAGGDLEGLWFRAMRAMGAVDVLQKPLDRQALLALLASPDGAGAALPRLSA